MTPMSHPVPEPILARIDDVVVSFAMLESGLQWLAWSLVRDDQRIGQVITAELSLQNLRALVVSLYLLRFGEDDSDIPQLRELMKRVSQVEAKRNQIIHSVWAAGDSADSVTRIKTTAKEKRGYHPAFEHDVTAAALDTIAVEIRSVAEDVQQFDRDHLLPEQIGYVEADEDGTLDLSKATTKPPPAE